MNKARINKNVTTHMFRHSFETNSFHNLFSIFLLIGNFLIHTRNKNWITISFSYWHNNTYIIPIETFDFKKSSL